MRDRQSDEHITLLEQLYTETFFWIKLTSFKHNKKTLNVIQQKPDG